MPGGGRVPAEEPGIAIALHSYADPEVFFMLEALLQVWRYEGDSGRWLTASPGDLISILGNLKHAIRNNSAAPVTVVLTTTPAIYEFFRELDRFLVQTNSLAKRILNQRAEKRAVTPVLTHQLT